MGTTELLPSGVMPADPARWVALSPQPILFVGPFKSKGSSIGCSHTFTVLITAAVNGKACRLKQTGPCATGLSLGWVTLLPCLKPL